MSCPTKNAVIEPTMVHMPWPKMFANAACMSGTPRSAFTPTHHSAGARLMAKYAAKNAYEMNATAKYEMKRTPRGPKYSLMISVTTNTIGHMSTPAVNDSEPC